ncbi:Putative ribonuclease H protein At1g65750 [Linum grandiflorum]
MTLSIISNSHTTVAQNLGLGTVVPGRDMEVWWRPALQGWVTVTSDGSFIPSSRHAAVGGAVQDWQGRLLGAYTANLGSCSITRAELRGAIESLRLAWQLGHRRVALQMDSKAALSILQAREEPSHQHASLVLQFRSLLQRDWIVTLSHVFREGNFLADCLARRGLFVPFGVRSVPLDDPEIRNWVLYDTLGISIPRRINVMR